MVMVCEEETAGVEQEQDRLIAAYRYLSLCVVLPASTRFYLPETFDRGEIWDSCFLICLCPSVSSGQSHKG